ncbi:hypothetical protein [Jiangella rhizosphaerae]|uniref:hypothetical protein n=1 Tax=Jiangella rhizosphaerae TaxID=2293569 RepID=UPI0011C3CD27|nr:hypothetical protein [Jiangella rhizosphaerae]
MGDIGRADESVTIAPGRGRQDVGIVVTMSVAAASARRRSGHPRWLVRAVSMIIQDRPPDAVVDPG